MQVKIRRAAFAAALFVIAACARRATPPLAKIKAAGPGHVGLALLLDGSQSAAVAAPGDLTPPSPVSFRWSFRAIPAGSNSQLNDPTLVQPSFTPDTPGDYQVQLVVNDGLLDSAPALATVKVTGDCIPAVKDIFANPTTPNVFEPVSQAYTAMLDTLGLPQELAP